MARRIGTICLMVLISISTAAAQSCSNTGNNCGDLTSVSQCTQAVISQCCSRCTELAGCINLGGVSNCFRDYTSASCYTNAVKDNCCLMCKTFEKPFLGNDCIYGDKSTACGGPDRCGEVNYARECCETCFTGTTPVRPITTPGNSTTIAATEATTRRPITTAAVTTAPTSPATCVDTISSCRNMVLAVPSICYNTTRSQACCATCMAFKSSREFVGRDIEGCPYGNRAAYCENENDFQISQCTNPRHSYMCCDKCEGIATTTAPATTTQPPSTCTDESASCLADARDVPSLCYNSNQRERCCNSCERIMMARAVIGFNVEDCPYGDRRSICVNDGFDRDIQCRDADTRTDCCDACVGFVSLVTTTTEPTVCEDQSGSNSCREQVNQVPSLCYNPEGKQACCIACNNFKNARQFLGFNVTICPYGDRATFCTLDDFNLRACRNVSRPCCDTCRDVVLPPMTTTMATTVTTDPTCIDNGLVTCNLPERYCYDDVSSFYSASCCRTCATQTRPELGETCLYGNREPGCNARVTPGEPCSERLQMSCCETCQQNMQTTTQDSCQDDTSACTFLVGNQGRNCYDLADRCCRTCRPFTQPDRPFECRYGDRISFCAEAACERLSDQCCATCADVTTILPTTTESACFDLDDDCFRGGLFNLRENPRRCYNDEVRGRCCGTCRTLADPDSATCAWGDRDPACALIGEDNLDCTDPTVGDVCCDTCDVTITTTMEPMTPPPGCTDNFPTCDDLTGNLFNCYPETSSFISNGCCATCFAKKKRNLPETCMFGDRISGCSNFLTSDALCLADANVNRDCCETCFGFQTTTSTMGPTACPNVWTDSTCELLFEQLNGDCTTIQDQCCRTCLMTTTPMSTTVTTITTEDPCQDTLATSTCLIIIETEGKAQCATDFMMERCCRSCREIMTTTPMATTAILCPGDELPNCARLQELLPADICDAESSSNLIDTCCAFCADPTTTTSTTMGPTTLPPGCNGNIWDRSVCGVAIMTSPLEDPCQNSDVIADNCCLYCFMMSAATTTAATMMTTMDTCEGDSPVLDCAALDRLADVCNDADVAPLCCAFCNPESTTTTSTSTTTATAIPPTTTGSGPCSRNFEPITTCRAIFTSQGGILSCATDFMLDNCCLFCSSQTVPTTMEPTTVFNCQGDNPDLNCTNLDAAFSGRMCDPGVDTTSSLRRQCCQYCGDRPTTTIPTTVTTAVCIDVDNSVVCDALADNGVCSTSTGMTQCCETCRNRNNDNQTTITTTATPGTTVECVDDPNFNCSELANDIDPCVGTPLTLCCQFCQGRTTLAPTSPPPTSAPCSGNTFPDAVCAQRNTTFPNFCNEDPVWSGHCCEWCGQPVVTGTRQATTVTAAPTNAPNPTTTDPTAVVCNGDVFDRSLCVSKRQSDSTMCEQADWYEVCCDFCDSFPAFRRKKRSVDTLSRQRRQAPPSSCVNTGITNCEERMRISATVPLYLVCIEDDMRANCCEYCIDAPTVIPEGEQMNGL